jgi:hypothetical protein
MGFWIGDLKEETNDLKVNAWNWRPTLVLLEQFQVLEADELERMGFTGGGGSATPEQARVIAQRLRIVLEQLDPAGRYLLDGSNTSEPDDFVLHHDDAKNYGATREWLEKFASFCEHCQGFRVI